MDEDEELPDNLIMDDTCLTALAKNGELLQDLPTIIEFLKPWYGMARYAEEILVCIQKNSSFMDLPDLPTKAERKSTLAAARTSKKLKGLDDPVLAEKSRMTAMQDAWLVNTGKANAATKARIKKAADAEKKALEKREKIKKKEKAKSKEEALQMRKLAASNRRAQIGTFKDLLSDLPTGDDSHNNLLLHPTGITPSSHPNLLPSTTPVAVALLACQTGLQAKKAVSETLA